MNIYGVLGLIVLGVLQILAFRSDAKVSRREEEVPRVLGGLPCPRCHKLFGIEAASRASKDYYDSLRKWHQEHPHSKLRLSGRFSITCSHCGQASSFSYIDHTLRADDE